MPLPEQSIIPVVAAVIRDAQNKILISRRPPQTHLGGMWEFPGGKINDGETSQQALKREIHEELGVDVEVRELLWEKTFTYPEKTIHIFFFACALNSPPEKIRAIQVANFKWASVNEFDRFQFPPADAAFIKRLMKGNW